MVINGDVVTLNKREVEELIDRECRKRLGISRKEFIQRRNRGELPNSSSVHEIEMLLKIAK